ncbi:hypothetical protein ACIQC5_23795 [Paenarthrobacter sp. NPDC092416]|uniref:hypothetical protein n=1 Tax=Paenarthrobacter sp. NPDC092416 TaxID=3364386 RepID=UPI003829E6A6
MMMLIIDGAEVIVVDAPTGSGRFTVNCVLVGLGRHPFRTPPTFAATALHLFIKAGVDAQAGAGELLQLRTIPFISASQYE